MGNPHGLLIVAGPDSLRLEDGRQGRARGAGLQILDSKLGEVKQVIQGLEMGFGVRWPDCQGSPDRWADRHIEKALRQTERLALCGTLNGWRARLLLAGSAELCD